MAEVLVGIDLGTTNSEVAAFVDGEVRVLGGAGNEILPSCVALDDAGRILVGTPARNQALAYPERTVLSVKRLMGAPAQVRLGDQTFRPQEISAFILKELKRRAEAELGQEIRKAVITVPAYFSDAQRAATQEAGALAGLEVVRILNEPTAASLAYGLDRDAAQTVLIYDLGGGTFDVSLVRIEDEVTEVLASHGDNHLGGDDFDQVLVELFLDYLEEEHGVDFAADDRAIARLRRAAERAKVRLSTDPEVAVREEHLGEGEDGTPIHLDLHLTRADFEDEIADLVDRTLVSVDQVLSDAQLEPEAIDQVLLVGGSTRIPLVAERLQERLGKAPRRDLHPDLCVALGAGVLASRIGGHDVERILVDVTPYSFGPSFLGDLDGRKDYAHCYRPIIRRNTPLPVSHTELYRTSYPDQREIDVRIYQGDDEDALNNILVGRFRVDDLTPQPAFSPILCRMDLDVDGILHVTITEKATGKEKKLAIEGALRTLSSAEIEEARARLESLVREDVDDGGTNGKRDEPHADTLVPRARAARPSAASSIPEDRRREAQDLLERAVAAKGEMGEEDREEAEELVRVVERALEVGDESTLDNALADLNDLLFYVEQR